MIADFSRCETRNLFLKPSSSPIYSKWRAKGDCNLSNWSIFKSCLLTYSLLEKISLSRDREKTKPDKLLKDQKRDAITRLHSFLILLWFFSEKNLGKDERKYFVKILTVFDYKLKWINNDIIPPEFYSSQVFPTNMFQS